MTSLHIPQDIYDEIFSDLRHDEASLRSCSLVCHAWLPRARYHLFRNITLDPSSRSHRFRSLTWCCPDIAPLVRTLELCGRASTRRGWWDPENGLPTNLVWPTLHGIGPLNPSTRRDSDVLETLTWLRNTFATSASSASHSHDPPGAIKLPHVRSLRLDEVTFNSETAAFLAAAFPRVESLTLNGCRAMSFASLVDLLWSFQQLRTLHLLSAEWLPHQPGHSPPGQTSTSTCLRTLAHLEFTRDIFVQPVLHWLLKAAAHKTIHSLKCSITTQTSANALRTFLDASGPTLVQLSITLSESRDPSTMLEATRFDLSPCTGLERLTLQCSPPRSMPEHSSLSWILILLSKVRSPCLHEIRLSIASTQLPRLNLEGLDVVLAQSCYGSIQRLTFALDHTRSAAMAGKGSVEQNLRERLSTAHAQGIIRMEYQ